MKVTPEAFKEQFSFDKRKNFLGKGAFGQTYSAYSKLREELVVIKFFKGDYSNHDLLSETKKAIKLEHPNLIRYYDFFEIDYGDVKEQAGILEYANGGDFSQFLKTSPGVSDLKPLLSDILRGLIHLEEYNIIHRDIKLENILLSSKSKESRMVAKLADFGLAQYTRHSSVRHKQSPTPSLSGTPAYMAPEIVDPAFAARNSEREIEIRKNIDLWALGILIYYIFHKRPPFGTISENRSLREIMKNIITRHISKTEYQIIPDPFREIVKKCLVKNAKDRIQSAKELLHMLNRTEIDHHPRTKIKIPENKRIKAKINNSLDHSCLIKVRKIKKYTNQ